MALLATARRETPLLVTHEAALTLMCQSWSNKLQIPRVRFNYHVCIKRINTTHRQPAAHTPEDQILGSPAQRGKNTTSSEDLDLRTV